MIYDFLIVGAGLFGSVFASAAIKAGRRVMVTERRAVVGGNIYTEEISGIQTHFYGPHIFHTNNAVIWRYVNRFAEFRQFINSPIANYRGEIYSLPFNMYTFNQMWGIKTPEEAKRIINEQRKEINGVPQNLEEQAISMVGRDIYEKLVKGYTEKQWGKPCSELPASIINRIPVRFTYNNNYFDARYQGIPTHGYTEMIKEMLSGADVFCGVDYLENRVELEKTAEKIIFTGPIDEYYGYSLGNLEYRSLRFEHEVLDVQNYQGNAVVNYTDSETPWTRIIEHRHFSDIESGKTVVTREYSAKWEKGAEPYYTVNDAKNLALYKSYRVLAEKDSRVIFGGRLGEYRYYDMDAVVASALSAAEKLI